MSPEFALISTVGLAAFGTTVWALIDRRVSYQHEPWPATDEDPRPIDILRRGQLCPWPTDTEMAANRRTRRGGSLIDDGQRPEQVVVALHGKGS